MKHFCGPDDYTALGLDPSFKVGVIPSRSSGDLTRIFQTRTQHDFPGPHSEVCNKSSVFLHKREVYIVFELIQYAGQHGLAPEVRKLHNQSIQTLRLFPLATAFIQEYGFFFFSLSFLAFRNYPTLMRNTLPSRPCWMDYFQSFSWTFQLRPLLLEF